MAKSVARTRPAALVVRRGLEEAPGTMCSRKPLKVVGAAWESGVGIERRKDHAHTGPGDVDRMRPMASAMLVISQK